MSRRRTTAMIAVAVALTAACSPADGGPTEGTPSSASSSESAGATPGGGGATTTGTSPVPGTGDSPAPVDDVTVADTLATGLAAPWGLAVLPDGDALVTLRDEARAVIVTRDGDVLDVTGDGADQLADQTRPDGEGGLLGVAVLPGGTEASVEVVLYRSGQDDNAVLRGTLTGTELGSLTPVVEGIPRARTHNGGQVAVGPDGLLYVSTGDAGEPGRAQDPESLGGKILRVTLEGEPAPDNPDPDSPVFSLGHRNVQGLGWSDDGTMYASEFGQNALDEVNRVVAGGNYGWPLVEGDDVGVGVDEATLAELVAPVATWSTDVASPSGLAVTPEGVWLAGLRGQRLWLVPTEDTGSADGGAAGEPRDFLTGELGRLRGVVAVGERELWVLTNATDGRGDPGPDDDRLVRVTY